MPKHKTKPKFQRPAHNPLKKKAQLPPRSHAKQQQQKQKAGPKPQASQKHDIPFGTYDKILLVGEGDFSFTRSLVVEHGCANVTATSFDDEDVVREKYPTFDAIAQELGALTPPVPIHHGIDATKLSSYKVLRANGHKGDDDDDNDDDDDDDARPWDVIGFLFPHTGGLSTDVNRQVRNNQKLLVTFFEACVGRGSHRAKTRQATEFLRTGGRVVVALFEGEPYTLWNVRDLARHAGLRVVESWRWDWAQYPGYRHVRTLGKIEGGGGWRGEEREARCFVFEKVAAVEEDGGKDKLQEGGKTKKEEEEKKTKRKRKRRGRVESETDSDED